MGKGTRNRQNRIDAMQPVIEARDDAKRFDRNALIFGIIALVLLAATYTMQIVSQSEMMSNLQNDVYLLNGNSKDDIAMLDSILPSGILSAGLITVGLIASFVLTTLHCPRLSLIGMGVAAIGAVMFIPFVMQLGVLFPEYTVPGTQVKRGLSFAKLLWKHYSMLLPIAVMIPAVVYCFRAKSKREVADVMQSALETQKSTLSLDE